MSPLADDDALQPPKERLLNSRAIDDDEPLPAPGLLQGPLAPGMRLGGYELLDEAGAGGFSVVWRARAVDSGEIVALKLPRVPEFIAHLRREALIASRIQNPQVANVREVRLDHDPPFLVMPYVAGANLALHDEPPPPTRILAAFRIFRRIVDVVTGLHDAGVVHGDLKPGNIRFDDRGTCYLLDLGLARLQVTARQQSSLRASVVSVTGEKIGGTLDYMAPEVVAGEKPTTASDVYALGVILHHLLCGKPPAFGVSPRELNRYLPPGTSEFLRQMLHPAPTLRIYGAGALLDDVDRFIYLEERCLRRRNGHERRLVFAERMRTLARGIKWVGLALLMLLAGVAVALTYATVVTRADYEKGRYTLVIIPVYLFGVLTAVLGVTTINAWLAGIPEKTYKNRKGHALWNFMMQ
ncbi:MAG: serine/threonine-protein kinase [Planctomycetota bacterium]